MAVPKLRFKEFEGDWNLSSLANISSIITGNTPSTSNREYYDGEFLFVSPVDIQENRYIEKTKTTLTANGFSKCRHIPENSVLFVCIGSTIGKVAQNKVICATNQQINAVIPKKGYSSDFLYLQLERLAPNIKLNAGVQAVPLINKTEFGKTLLNTPTFIEQTKIASFLSSVDEKINQLTQKHQLLSQYKQGMMQKLFSQQIRFKADDGSEFGEWENISVKEIFDVTRGQVLAVSNTVSVADTDYKYPVFSSQTKQKGLMGFYKKYLFEDALTWTTDGANAGDVNFRKGKFYCTNVCGVLLSKKGYANLCIAEILNKVTHKYVSYVGNPKLMNNVMSEIPITIPSNLEEQTKIANFLSAIDQKIEVTAQQIEQAKQWKKGLLQQMFV